MNKIQEIIDNSATTIDLRETHSLDSIEKLILKSKQNNITQILLLDTGYLLDNTAQQNSNYILISEHLNLSIDNPTINKHPVKFYAIDNLYHTPSNIQSYKIACIQENIIPTKQQTIVLQKQGINYYCNKLPLIALLCAYYGVQVIGVLEIK